MCTRLVVSAVVAMVLVAAPEGWGVRQARAGVTIKSLVDDPDKQGKLKVGSFTFEFDVNSVSGDRDSEQIIVDAVGKNSVVFTFANNAEFRLVSNMTGAQTLTVTIAYTVTSTGSISGAQLKVDNHFAANTANGASSELVETLRGMEQLAIGTPTPANSKQNVLFADLPMTLTVENVGKIHVPIRGAQGNADEAQLNDITNTFSTVPEPGTLAIFATLALVTPFPRRRRSP